MSDDTTTETTPPDVEPTGEPETEGLGDGGRKALDTERTARKAAEKQAREASERLVALEAADTRRAVAAEKGLSDAQAAFLTGDDRDAMAAKADELLEAFKPDEGEVPRRPRERMRPGAVPAAEPVDLGSVADEVMRG